MRLVWASAAENLVVTKAVGDRIDLEVAVVDLRWKFIRHYNGHIVIKSNNQ